MSPPAYLGGDIMQKIIKAGMVITVLLTATVSVHTQTATKDEAKALVEKAVVHVKKNGVEASCSEFQNEWQRPFRTEGR
jgi:tRNA U55 pseudouridine synthase TruB